VTTVSPLLWKRFDQGKAITTITISVVQGVALWTNPAFLKFDGANNLQFTVVALVYMYIEKERV
jgi:hypothetical protein